MVWGESNSINFLNWADYCRNNVMKSKNIASSGGENFKSRSNSAEYLAAKEQILGIIRNNRTISVQNLYNAMPTTLVANPTTKYIILQLYFEDNLQIQGQTKSNSDHETDYVLTFVKNALPKQNTIQPRNAPQKKQSNIEDLLDNNWMANGRKLEFDKKETLDKSKLNISLKNDSVKPTNVPPVKPTIDIRDYMKKEEKIAPIVNTDKPERKLEIENKNLKYINISIPKEEKILESKESTATIDLTYKPEPIISVQDVEEKVFYGLSAYEIYYLENFMRDAARFYKEQKARIKIIIEVLRAKADVIYLKNKSYPNGFWTFLLYCSFIIIIPIFIYLGINSNKVRKKAIKDYNRNLKKAGFEQIKKELKEKHPKIVFFS